MPWNSYSARETAKTIVKDAVAKGRWGKGNYYKFIGVGHDVDVPVCALGHMHYAIRLQAETAGIESDLTSAFGLSTDEQVQIIKLNDRLDYEAVLDLFDQIPVGESDG